MAIPFSLHAEIEFPSRREPPGWIIDFIPACDLEIRRTEDMKRVAQIPYSDYMRRTSKLNESARKRIGQLANGEYLISLCIGDARCSNVALLEIDSKYEPEMQPTLEAVPLPPNPWRNLPYLGIRAIGPTPQDPKLTNYAVFFPRILIDGVEHTWTHKSWRGPVGPISSGRSIIWLKWMDHLEPPLVRGRKYTIVVKVAKYESAPVEYPANDTLGRAWDKATPHVKQYVPPEIKPPLPSPVMLEGKVTGPDGKAGGNYWLVLLGSNKARFETRSDAEGKYKFTVELPAGLYQLRCSHPPDSAGHNLVIDKVQIKAGKTAIQDLNMVRKYSISGKVTYEDGSSTAGFEVMSTWVGMDSISEFNTYAVVDEKGQYTLWSPFEIASYVGISMTGPHPPTYSNVKGGRNKNHTL